MKRIIFVLILFSVVCCFSFDYNLSKPIKTEDDIADLYYSQEISEEIYSELWDLFNNPVNVNTANSEDLERLPGITPELASAIIAERPFESETALSNLLGRGVFEFIDAFIFIERKRPVKISEKRVLKTQLAFRFVDEVSSYYKRDATPYLHLRGRFDLDKKWHLGFVTERKWATYDFEVYDGSIKYDDNLKIIAKPGDVIITPKSTQFPVPKFFLGYTGNNFEFILGNFSAGFGLGVTFNESGRRLLYGYSGDISANQTYDYKRLFGLGLKYSIDPLTLYAFASHQKDKLTVYSGILEGEGLDLVESQEEYELYASSARTMPNFITKTVIGGHISIGDGNNLLGLTIFNTNEEFATDNYRPIRYGEDMFNATVWGVNAQFSPIRKLLIQSELALLPSGAHGFVIRSFLKENNFRCELIFRDFDRFFTNPYSYTFATWVTPSEFSAQNERGIRLNSEMKFDKTVIGARFDIWRQHSLLASNFDGTAFVRFPLTPLVNVAFSQRFRDRDLARDINQIYITDRSETDRTHYTYITVNYIPTETFSMSTIYRYKLFTEYSSPQTKPSSTFQYRINYKTDILSAMVQLKFSDDNLYRKYDSSSSEEYREWQFNVYRHFLNRKLKLTLGYKSRTYIEDNTLRSPDTVPERVFRFYVDWRS